MTDRAISVFAPAKINLTLHVTGRRTDGYHLLDSLVAFADIGDSLKLAPGAAPAVTVAGPEAAQVPVGPENLVLRVARLFPDGPGAVFHLTKTLPVASGIGGGSADAAAAFRGLVRLRGEPAPGDVPAAKLLPLGADIPACLASAACRMQGIGEIITALPDLPPLDVVLANPRLPASTGAVFRALDRSDNAAMPEDIPRFADGQELTAWLSGQRNDLQAPAERLEPAITRLLAALAGLDGCRLARMSGSGATCFGIFDDADAATGAARRLARIHGDWWITPARLGTMTEAAQPVVS